MHRDIRFLLPWFSNSRFVRVTQFQSRLLKELSPSANTAKNWRNQIKTFLALASGISDILFLYAFVTGEEGKRNVELFWAREPVDETRTVVETMLKQSLAEDSEYGAFREFRVIHTIVNPGLPMPAITERDINLLSRTLHIPSPPESGIVGVGLPARGWRHSLDQVVIDSIQTACVNVISFVKALSAYTQDVERFATRDPLTNLYNQTSFWDLLEYEASRSRRQEYKFSLLLIDLDNFKSINDTYGHEAGDAFLKSFSGILKSAVRSGDIVSRYAGDQFVAILPVCDEGQASFVSRRILDNVRNNTSTLGIGASIKGTVSIGVAVHPDHAKSAKDLFLLANNMLNRSKSSGKDRLSIPSEQDNMEALKSMGEKNILVLEALHHRRIIPYFQPIMNVKDERIEAFEVLARIILPDRVISAAEFIETAESMGAIGRLDYQIFERALAKVRDCNYAGNLFINLSLKALFLNEFMPTIRRILRDYGLNPVKLIFEISERDMMKNLNLADKFINELKGDGFRFAIDDFGSGYSSFQYIKTFDIDFLKVDGELVRRMGRADSTEKHIVTSIASLAGHLGIKTVAEYVESQEILSDVQSAGINYAQGYYIQKPSPDLF